MSGDGGQQLHRPFGQARISACSAALPPSDSRSVCTTDIVATQISLSPHFRPGTWQFDPATGTFDRGQMVPLSLLESRRARAVQVAKVGLCWCLKWRRLAMWGW